MRLRRIDKKQNRLKKKQKKEVNVFFKTKYI